MRHLHPLQWVLALAAAVLAVAGTVLLALAANSSGADCTFDNFSCRSNDLLADALRCLAGAALAGAATLLLRWIRNRGGQASRGPSEV